MHRVAIFQPGLQHSYQLAWALRDLKMLSYFVSGVPTRRAADSKPKWMPAGAWRRLRVSEIERQLLCPHPEWWGLMKLATSFGGQATRFENMHRCLYAFDAWTARRFDFRGLQAVIAYENAALNTFRIARKHGALCILDAASIHFATGNILLESPSPEFQKCVDNRKAQEIEAADFILCCSRLARDTYINAGVRPEKVLSVPLGAWYPSAVATHPPAVSRPIRFIFAGVMQRRKSIDFVLAAFERLQIERPGAATLDIVGGSDSGEWAAIARRLPNVSVRGAMSQVDLFRAFENCDCLLLPSRFDSFGMVVVEAMAAGIPAVVSEMTGAKEIIEDFPGSGWIVNADQQSIYTKIEKLVDEPTELVHAKIVARQAAGAYSWSAYRERIASLFNDKIFDAQAHCKK